MCRVAVWVLACLMPVAYAQQWNAEPTIFRGVKLGVPFDGQFPECKKNNRGAYEYAPQTTCFQSDGKPNPNAHGAVLANVFNLPDIGIDTAAAVEGLSSTQVAILDGEVVRVRIVFNSGFFDSFHSLLVEKYGRPNSDLTETFQNKMGDTFEGKFSKWRGQQVSVVAEQYWGSLNYSLVDATVNTFLVLEDNEREYAREPE